MTLLELVRAHGRVDLSVVDEKEGKVRLLVQRGGSFMEMLAQDVTFAVGGGCTIVTSVADAVAGA